MTAQIALASLAPAAGRAKKPWEATDRIVAAVPCGEGAILASHYEGVVRRVKTMTGKAEEQAAWTDEAPGKCTQFLAVEAGKAAVSYWGGLVRILDVESGKRIAEQRFEQDVAAMVWWNGSLLVGLADGRLVTLAMP